MEYPNLKVAVTLRLSTEGRKAFGPGVAQLMQGIRQTGSIRKTAVQMAMSYNKAWNILKSCEKVLGFPLLERQIGGIHGGGAKLTEDGEAFLEQYLRFSEKAEEMLEILCEEYFPQKTGKEE